MYGNNYGFHRYSVSNTGTFSFSTLLCSNNVPATLIAEDLTAAQQSALYNTSLVVGNNTIGNLQSCNISTTEFINYSINGTSYSITEPPDTINTYPYFSNSLPYMVITGGQIAGSNSAYMHLNWDGMGVNSLQPLIYFGASQMASVSILNPINVRITEYGAIGEFVSGNFAGTMSSNQPPNPLINVTCSFRVRRSL